MAECVFVQKLTLENFLNLEKAEIVLDGLTVLIGEQASGKSIVARLFYFFNDYLSDLKKTILINEDKRRYDRRKKNKFYQLFPKYALKESKFHIRFEKDGLCIDITSEKESEDIKISSSKEVSNIYNSLKRKFSYICKKYQPDKEMSMLPPTILLDILQDKDDQKYSEKLQNVLFVPAARAFYAALREEVFSILSLDEKIDQIIIQFGGFYDTARRRLNRSTGRNPDIEKILQEVIKGKYQYKNGQDWIVSGTHQIEVNKASSGQQEALPLLVSLISFPAPHRTLIIEEPEAHLFPNAQAKILDYIVKQSKKCDVLITTHSPYILSSLNNCLIKGSRGIDSVKNVTSVKADKVNVYALRKGFSESIMDNEEGLPIISTEYIDSISEEIQDNLLKLLGED